MEKYYYIYNTVIGDLIIIENSRAIVEINSSRDIEGFEKKETALIKWAHLELEEYFKGKRKIFTFPIRMYGTLFQERVWKELQNIPYGETRSYKYIGEQIENPKGARAVGMANNKNKLLIVVPCHRVISANGDLNGFAIGINIKKILLELEAKNKETPSLE
ncbi:methylated-DNA-[protein]-cysteine S-methyltransferase [Cetobacterium ceti]|uniref:methylated-DNA--[protein]-cysteine S-methyltransferase n=1 Tax=Cetobacterium ceti TaxID=180163 RepID=A0A1T4K7Q6_9FUSO|nr:methylated-DNA--[protein]-cysteine S-methyltransferase [Cetobacterium ceti]SJZ38377.1 methylated-DNA-[protein]-cysteine S-methyltransferase [Cetobacterium ceti]